MIIFDIETGPAEAAELAKMTPVFEAPSNYKDPEKIAAAIEEKKKSWVERAALDATSGQVLAVGILTPEYMEVKLASTCGEKEVIETFWKAISDEPPNSKECPLVIKGQLALVGFYCKSFDLPFLIRRSWKLGIKIPFGVLNTTHRFFRDSVHDLLDTWRCENRDQTISLDSLAKFLGVGSKNGDGKDFAKMDTKTALAYLANDLELTKNVALKMGVIGQWGKE